jgi:hypothetical protein
VQSQEASPVTETSTGIWRELAEYARWAPSPHNTQPLRIKVLDEGRADLCFVPERGLAVGDPPGRFTQMTFGITAEILRIAAHDRGFELNVRYLGKPLYQTSGPEKVAELELVPAGEPIPDLDPALILQRRTDRNPYNNRLVPDDVIAELKTEAARYGHTFEIATDKQSIRWVKELNRDVLFHDLEHPTYRKELQGWLRFSDKEAADRRDGLSARAMVLPGWLLKAFFQRHRLFTMPGLKQVARAIYVGTMRGISTVGWIQGDFITPADWTRTGELMIRLWLILTKHGVAWQPYGSVITNDEARKSMVDKFGMSEGADGAQMVWLLVRLGYSGKTPVRSERLPLEEVLL